MKNYLIIGGATGIGNATAHKLSEAGNNVFASYNKTHLSGEGNIQSFQWDVLNDIPDLTFLPDIIDGLIYCPGRINLKPFARIKEEDFIEDYKVQVLGGIKIIQAILPRLKKSEQASVVLFSTVAVQTGFSFHSLVSSSKGAIEGLTRALAAELAPSIRVNCIAPSITDTPLASGLLSTADKKEANAQRHPLKKIGTAIDIANLAAFLVSDAASWVTGQIMHVDGGMSKLRV